jgi:hypothetical protein
VDVLLPRDAARVRGVDLIPAVDLERKVLDSYRVVPVISTVGRSYPEHRPTRRILQVDDFLRSSVGRKTHLLRPPERSQEGEVERERSLDVGDGEIDVVDSLCRYGFLPVALVRPYSPAALAEAESCLGVETPQ